MHLQARTTGESIPHRHLIATWYMPLKMLKKYGSTAPNSVILATFGTSGWLS